jgi:D-glycero-alpha-D-manno-heptose-7-phosphate kinase
VSFFGGGTDYPAWFSENGGSVLATSIDKYCYISIRHLPPFFEHKHRIVYSQIENVLSNQDIKHPAVKAIFEWIAVTEGLEVHHDGDLPARSGLGSSSSFTVGLINALNALDGHMVSKDQLARDAIHVEQNIIKENVGSQDQVCAAFGGFNKVDFLKNNSFTVNSVVLPAGKRELLQSHLMLFFTGFSRIASEIAGSKIANFKSREFELKTMHEMVNESVNLLQGNSPIEEFGRMLNEGWRLKRSLSDRVSTLEIDEIYQTAINAGAVGGKVLGAGGGGFLLLFAKPENQHKIKIALGNLIHVPFKFEDSGSQVVLYQPNGL